MLAFDYSTSSTLVIEGATAPTYSQFVSARRPIMPPAKAPVKRSATAGRIVVVATKPEVVCATSPSSKVIDGVRERAAARLRNLKLLEVDAGAHEGRQALGKSVDDAIAFLFSLRTSPPYAVTINDEGNAVIEFKDNDLYADLTFLEKEVSVYVRYKNKPSISFQVSLLNVHHKARLRQELNVDL